MKIETLYTLNNNLQNDKLSLLYQGNFSDDITERIIDISETSLNQQTDLQKIGKKSIPAFGRMLSEYCPARRF